MKNWLKHPSDINAPLTGAEMTGMTFAGTALAILNVVISVFISYYYTNVVGLSAATVGTLILITRIADGFSALGMGVVIKKTRNKWGQARPWSLLMALPLFVSFFLAFYVPENWDHTAKMVYACITYFCMINIALTPAGLIGPVLGTNMTINTKSRQKNAMISTILVLIGSVVTNVAVLQITQSMGDSFAAWRLMAILLGLLAFAGHVVQFLLTRERDTGISIMQDSKKSSIRESLPALIKNKYFIIMCFVGLVTAVDGAMAGCSIYYLRYVLSNMELLGALGITTLLPMLVGVALTPILAKKIPLKHMIQIGFIIKIITYAINLLFPGNLVLFLGFTVLRSLVGAPMMVNSSVYLLNTIEYGEYKTGIRANHLILSVSSVWSKIGSGIGGALIGWMLGIGGYDGAAQVQSLSAQGMIISIYFLIPMIASIAAFLLLWMYDLDKEYGHIINTLKMRKAPAAIV